MEDTQLESEHQGNFFLFQTSKELRLCHHSLTWAAFFTVALLAF